MTYLTNNICNSINDSTISVIRSIMLEHTLDNRDKVMQSFSVSERIKSAKPIYQFILDQGFEKQHEWLYTNDLMVMYRKGEGPLADFVHLTINENGWATAQGSGIVNSGDDRLDKFVFKLKQIVKENKMPHFQVSDENSSFIYALVDTGKGLAAQRIGSDSHPIVRENYHDSVLDAYDRTVKEFSTDDSDGFISIFSGPPGTGKSYIIRSLIDSIKNSLFLYVPASMISSFSGPSLLRVISDLSEEINDDELPNLIEVQSKINSVEINEEGSSIDLLERKMEIYQSPLDRKKKNKIVLVLEDADDVLAPRSQTDMAGINSILNLTDGILGKILNIRIIATTNTKAKEFDEAITRPGRLCAQSIVGTLSREHAQRIVDRESGGKGPRLPEGKYTLAEAYKIAKDENYLKGISKKKVGF